ncbi:hypothetical protein B296_00055467 [Ensete ventricosum]|uniref:Uncharacterized protein n=1 Tax=Ensete ventricosum TaxID=4639 RepID=A0A426XSA2_ENSVE|nr:hypothetical protein B296_00055467 [Ensete ventricosum]
MGQQACSTPDSKRLTIWQSEYDGPTSLQHPWQQTVDGLSDTVAMTWLTYNELAYAGINTPRPPLEGRTDILRRNRLEVRIAVSHRQTTEATLRI